MKRKARRIILHFKKVNPLTHILHQFHWSPQVVGLPSVKGLGLFLGSANICCHCLSPSLFLTCSPVDQMLHTHTHKWYILITWCGTATTLAYALAFGHLLYFCGGFNTIAVIVMPWERNTPLKDRFWAWMQVSCSPAYCNTSIPSMGVGDANPALNKKEWRLPALETCDFQVWPLTKILNLCSRMMFSPMGLV